MTTKREFRYHSEGQHAPRHTVDASAGHDSDAVRVRQQLKIRNRTESGNRPEGNDEYEQMVAENVRFSVHHMIEEAAFFIAMRRGFAPGNELRDWLQAEKDIHCMLRGSPGTGSHTSIIETDDHVLNSLRTEIRS